MAFSSSRKGRPRDNRPAEAFEDDPGEGPMQEQENGSAGRTNDVSPGSYARVVTKSPAMNNALEPRPDDRAEAPPALWQWKWRTGNARPGRLQHADSEEQLGAFYERYLPALRVVLGHVKKRDEAKNIPFQPIALSHNKSAFEPFDKFFARPWSGVSLLRGKTRRDETSDDLSTLQPGRNDWWAIHSSGARGHTAMILAHVHGARVGEPAGSK
ncbi:hypothetical protein PV08_06461 [Exophiala spinifera]|uniref:Uncharacterized protein n=1 Tax=Exophiala spinifera TaxID=91928 RepID=A0A0D2BYL2_9EURO|nr:uncharacterized protein PV08_06461 [Exophiala spinifera]KIW16409.1 hypothetical protein PV08_06461 [Exophiala spinifera]